MKRISVLIFNCILAVAVWGQGIDFFEGTWQEALVLAEKEDKLVFVDAYASWCGPCKRMAKEVFTKKEVGDFFNENFINLKLDMEKTDGLSFGSKYPVQAYPTLIFINGEGEIVKKHTGGQSVPALINLGKSALRSNDTSGDYKELYDKGNRDFQLVYDYVDALNRVGKPSLKISNDYIDSDPDITKEQKAAFLMVAVLDADSKLYDELMELKKEAIKETSEEGFTSKVQTAVLNTVKKSVEFDYPGLMDMAIEKLRLADLDTEERMELEAQMEYYKLTGRFDEWKDLSEKYLKKYAKKDLTAYTIQIAILNNDFAYREDAVAYAEELSKELVKKEDSLSNYYNYINLLLNQKRYGEARKYVEEAIEKGKKRKEEVGNFERILEFLESQ